MAVFDWRQTLGAGEIAFPTAITDIHVLGSGAAASIFTSTLGNGGVTAFGVTTGGGIIQTGAVAYPGSGVAGVTPALSLLPSGAGGILAVSGLPPGGPQVSAAGSPGSWAALSGWSEAPRAGEYVTSGGNGFLLTGRADGALASLAWSGTDLSLRDARPGFAPVAIVQGVGGTVFALSSATDSITAISLSATGTITPLVTVGAADGLGWSAPSAIEPLSVGGEEFLIVGASGSSALSVLAFRDGTFEVRDHVVDDLDRRFSGVPALDAVTVNGRGFVVAGGADGGITLFELLPGGRLVSIQTVEDSVSTTLTDVSAVALVDGGTWLQAVVASQAEPGLTVFARSRAAIAAPKTGMAGADTLTGSGADDLLVGGAGDDSLSGGGGDDILFDGPGSDVLRGGPGADIFVLDRDGAPDTILDFEPGVDRLDLSAFPGLYSVSALSVTTRSTGARLIFGDEVIDVVTADRSGLTKSMLALEDILTVTRPPLVPIGRDIVGGSGPDALEGAFAADRLLGYGGDDTLSGRDGGDLIVGGGGADTLDGGAGSDRLFGDEDGDGLLGQDGADLLFGGSGDDLLEGGTGGDLLVGGMGADTLSGGAGNDILRGGTDDDALFGEDGADRLHGGAGRDTLDGGAGRDWLDGGSGDDLLMGGTGADVFLFVEGFGADTIIDFETAMPGEVIDLTRQTLAGSWDAVSNLLTAGPSGAVIDFGNGDILTIAGIDPTSLGADDFLF